MNKYLLQTYNPMLSIVFEAKNLSKLGEATYSNTYAEFFPQFVAQISEISELTEKTWQVNHGKDVVGMISVIEDVPSPTVASVTALRLRAQADVEAQLRRIYKAGTGYGMRYQWVTVVPRTGKMFAMDLSGNMTMLYDPHMSNAMQVYAMFTNPSPMRMMMGQLTVMIEDPDTVYDNYLKGQL